MITLETTDAEGEESGGLRNHWLLKCSGSDYPLRDPVSLTPHTMMPRLFFCLPDMQKIRQQLQSMYTPFILILTASNKAGDLGGNQTLDGLMGYLREPGFYLEGCGGPRKGF